MNELDFQAELKKEVKKQGGYAFKMSNQFLVGIPDLFIKLPNFDTAIVECKLLPASYAKSGKGPIKTTPLQKSNLSRMQKAGGISGTVILIDQKWPQLVVITDDPYQERFDLEKDVYFERKRGEPWAVHAILSTLNAKR